MSAMKTTSDRVREESSAATRMGQVLRQIAASYRSAENSILGNVQSGNGNYGNNREFGDSGGGNSNAGNGTQNGNHKNSGVYSSDPVNLNTGNFILDNHDMEIPGFQSFVLGRFYNSMGTFTGMLAEGNETYYKYDSMGNILTKTNTEGFETNYVWDAGGRCIKVIAADGTATEYKYNEDDQVIYVKDAEGLELFRTFDAAGQLVAEEGLTWASDPSGYTKSFGDVAKETVIDTGMGALSGAVSKLTGKLTQKLAGSKPAQWLVSKMRNGGTILNNIADHITDVAHGKSSKWWSQMSKYIKNKHEAIANSSELRKKLFSGLLKNFPVYAVQEIWGKFTDKVKPSKVLWKSVKDKLSDVIKEWLGLKDSSAECAAAA